MARTPAVFVDRDDTLIVDVPYCSDPEEVRLLRGAAEGLRLLAENGFSIVVVTNQSGIGRGYFNERQLRAVNARLREELRSSGANVRAVYHCPHRPTDGCVCRKPRPGLLLRAADDLQLDLAASYMIGDREADIEAGRAAGTQTVLISNDRRGENGTRADYTAKNLVDAARFVIARNSSYRRSQARES